MHLFRHDRGDYTLSAVQPASPNAIHRASHSMRAFQAHTRLFWCPGEHHRRSLKTVASFRREYHRGLMCSRFGLGTTAGRGEGGGKFLRPGKRRSLPRIPAHAPDGTKTKSQVECAIAFGRVAGIEKHYRAEFQGVRRNAEER